jgi:hypothetical protein
MKASAWRPRAATVCSGDWLATGHRRTASRPLSPRAVLGMVVRVGALLAVLEERAGLALPAAAIASVWC